MATSEDINLAIESGAGTYDARTQGDEFSAGE